MKNVRCWGWPIGVIALMAGCADDTTAPNGVARHRSTVGVDGAASFVCTGTSQSYVVPTGVTQLDVEVAGARGSHSSNVARGGNGGTVKAKLPVAPGQLVYIEVGCAGVFSGGGFPNGGRGGNSINDGAGGGGSSSIYTTEGTRLIVGGAGGGAGGTRNGVGPIGGIGGNPASDGGGGGLRGRAGTQEHGGSGGFVGGITNGSAGSFLRGGSGGRGSSVSFGPGGGGGGGGYYGGGGGGGVVSTGPGGAGGGGSSYAHPSVTHVVFDNGVNTGDGFVIIKPADGTPPTTTANRNVSPNGHGWNNTAVVITLAASDNEGGSGVAQTYYSVNNAGCSASNLGACTSYTSAIELTGDGNHIVRYFSKDNAGNIEGVNVLTVRIDRAAPQLNVSATPAELWPVNHKMRDITVSVTASDVLSGLDGWKLVSVTSTGGDASDFDGWLLDSVDQAGQLRATRAGNEDDRRYTLVYRAVDKAGNSVTAAATVRVPHDQRR